MAKQIEGVYENIIACATKEFLNKGYADASLRTIATEAHTTTGSIYTRFGDKEGLFEAIVGKHYDKIIEMYKAAQDEFASLPEEYNLTIWRAYQVIVCMTDFCIAMTISMFLS